MPSIEGFQIFREEGELWLASQDFGLYATHLLQRKGILRRLLEVRIETPPATYNGLTDLSITVLNGQGGLLEGVTDKSHDPYSLLPDIEFYSQQTRALNEGTKISMPPGSFFGYKNEPPGDAYESLWISERFRDPNVI